MESANYHPDPSALPSLGTIAGLIPQAQIITQRFRRQPRILAVLPGGELYFDSELQLDTDGAPELSGDATQQSDTSLHYHDGKAINANHVPYFVLPQPVSWPAQFGIRLGDFAAVIFREHIGFAVFADFGPADLLGEGSVALLRALGEERVRPDGSVRDVGMGPGVITIVFPKSGAIADRTDQAVLLAALSASAPTLFQSLGGVLPNA